MRHQVDPIELIRKSNPVPDAHQLPGEPTASFEALIEEIIGMNHRATTPATDTPPERPGPKRRMTRVAVILAASLVIASASVAGATIVLLQPDPEQAALVDDVFDPARGDIHPLDWRPDLRAEQTGCLLPGAEASVQEMLGGIASGFPLQELLTAEHLAIACTDDNAYARENGYTAAEATVCVTDVGRHVKPTVVIDGTDCTSAAPDLRAITEQDLASINGMRAVEVAMLAVPSETGCPTFSEAREWVYQQVSELGLGLEVTALDQGSGCYRGNVDWDLDRVHVETVGPQINS